MGLTQRIEEAIGEKLRNFDSLPTDKRKAVLDLFFKHLTEGGAYDLSSGELCDLITVLQENGLNTQAHKLTISANAVIRQDPEESYNRFARDMPDYFAEQIESGKVLSRGEMRLLAKSGKDTIFERLFDHNTAYGLGILPSYENQATRELEAELLQAMQTYQDCPDVKSLRDLKKRLGKRADIFQLKQVGEDLYTFQNRKLGDAQPTGGIEYKVATATPVEGPRFMPTRVSGYYGILRFYTEEMARIAPKGANAFLDGNGILKSVEFGGMWSPIVAGNALRPINQPDDQYHIVPVKFFHVEVDRSQKYVTDTEELPCEGGHAWREVVKPRGQSEIVSKSDRAFVIGG